jgi:serine/threonine-protein kinase
VPGYEIVEELGRGGMAVVYRARQLNLQRYVALKMILSGAHAGPAETARFRIEAEAVAQLQHPHIVQIYEVGQHNGCPYLALELLEGGNLAQRLTTTSFTPEQAASLVKTLARTIHAAHQKGIVHRDLKPGNILLQDLTAENAENAKKKPVKQSEGRTENTPFANSFSALSAFSAVKSFVPKITDFGLAKRADTETGLTRTGAIVGTPSYMAPEQAEGKREVGPAADVYSLGAILYELLTGRPPFQADTPIDTVLQVVAEDPVPPRKVRPKVPRDLETICLKCLEKEPRRRYPSAEALADDLGCYLQGEPIAARPPGVLGRLVRWAYRRPALAVTLAALVLFYLVHLVLLALGTEGQGGFFHWFVTGLAALWAAGAMACQWWVTWSPRKTAATYCWAALDVIMLTVLLSQGDGPRSAMLVGYHLLIAAAALRFRIMLVWFVTGLSVVSYLGVVAETLWRRPQLATGLKDWVNFVLSLLILGFVQQLLLRRVRTAISA